MDIGKKIKNFIDFKVNFNLRDYKIMNRVVTDTVSKNGEVRNKVHFDKVFYLDSKKVKFNNI